MNCKLHLSTVCHAVCACNMSSRRPEPLASKLNNSQCPFRHCPIVQLYSYVYIQTAVLQTTRPSGERVCGLGRDGGSVSRVLCRCRRPGPHTGHSPPTGRALRPPRACEDLLFSEIQLYSSSGKYKSTHLASHGSRLTGHAPRVPCWHVYTRT